MKIDEMTVSEIETRLAAISEEINADDADLDALEAETRSLKAEMEKRRAAEEKRNEIRDAVANGDGETTKEFEKEEKKTMDVNEIRNTREYCEAFANYLKSGRDDECRALLSTNATGGQVPVPVRVEGRIRTAWERSELMNLVRKTYVRGNLKVGFELSADGALVHTEGSTANTEESLTFGITTLTPESIKKWIGGERLAA